MAPFNNGRHLLARLAAPAAAALALLSTATPTAHARLEVAKTLGDHMVLQRAPHRAAIYGHADPFARVSVAVRREQNATAAAAAAMEEAAADADGMDPPVGTYERSYHTWANAEGKFTVLLDPVPVGSPTVAPHTITVENARTLEWLELRDVYFGEVWLCSGQSNMQMTVGQCFERDAEGETAESYPLIRLFTVATNTSTEPLDDVAAPHQPWSVAGREAVLGNDWEHFSAVCFFFGRRLADHLKVPIGLVASSYGGTPIQAWSSPYAVRRCNDTTPSSASASASSSSSAAAAAANAAMRLRGPQQRPQQQEADIAVVEGAAGGPNDPSVLYNAMLHPLRKMAFKGAIWYQGEADAGRPAYYECAFPRMVRDWRRLLRHSRVPRADGNDGEDAPPPPPMPFGFVQLSSYDSGIGAQGTDIGRMRMAQYSAFQEPNVFMAAAFDLGDKEGGIHPRDKQDLAFRLGNAGLFTAYGVGLLGSSLGPFISRAVAWKVPAEHIVQVMMTLDNVEYQLTYTHVPNVLEVLLDPSQPDATEGALTVSAYKQLPDRGGKNATFIFSFPLPASNASSGADDAGDGPPEVLLRYGYRNNVCPSRTTPYAPGIDQASCGLYGKSHVGFVPILPVVKRVALLPFDPTVAATNVEEARAEAEVLKEA